MIKNKIIILTAAFIVLIMLIVLGYNYLFNPYPDADFEAESLNSVRVTYDPGAIVSPIHTVTLTQQADIEVLIACVHKIEESYKKRVKNIQIAPIKYKIEYTFKNGSVKSFTHTVFPSTAASPFKEFFQLETVIKQTNTLFLYDISDIGMATANYSPSNEFRVTYQNKITDMAIIEELLDVGREIVLSSKGKIGSSCGVNFYDKNDSSRVLCGFDIRENTDLLNDISQKCPELKEILEKAIDNDFQ